MNLIALLQIGQLGNHPVEGLVKELSKVPLHNTQVEKGVFSTVVYGWAKPSWILWKHSFIHCDNIPVLEKDTVDEADKVREAVEQGTKQSGCQRLQAL
jgi:hypothetical protein